jgi:hypothetical protein
MMIKLLALSMCLSAFQAFAGAETGGGGDASEERVNEIRKDILQWIKKGGSKSLNLPARVTYAEYVSKMTDILADGKVVIGFVEKDHETDEELQVSVKGTPKTCRSFISKKDFLPHILCNIKRFEDTSDHRQYMLIHHEYAGLSGVEENIGAASDYDISTYITDYLTYQTVLRLAVKDEKKFPDFKIADGNIIDFEAVRDIPISGRKCGVNLLAKHARDSNNTIKVGTKFTASFVQDQYSDGKFFQSGEITSSNETEILSHIWLDNVLLESYGTSINSLSKKLDKCMGLKITGFTADPNLWSNYYCEGDHPRRGSRVYASSIDMAIKKFCANDWNCLHIYTHCYKQ